MTESLLIQAKKSADDLSSSLKKVKDETSGIAQEAKKVTQEFKQAVDAQKQAAGGGDWEFQLKTPLPPLPPLPSARESSGGKMSVSEWVAKQQAEKAATEASATSKAAESAQAEKAGRIGETVGNAISNGASRMMRTVMAAAGFTGLTAFALSGMGKARETDVSTDQLLRTLRGTTSGFDGLKDRLSEAGDKIKMSTEETARLSLSFSRLAGVVNEGTALTEVQGGVLAGRAWGLEDETLPQWLGEMRWRMAGDSNTLLPMVGTMAASGQMPGRVDELLRGLMGFTDRMERVLLTAPDLGGFSDKVMAMNAYAVANNLPGLRGQAGMDVLGAFDRTLASPGGGEAGEMFMYRFLASKGITDPFEQKYFREEGMASKPGLLREFMEYLRKDTGMEGKQLLSSGSTLTGLSMHAIENLLAFDDRNVNGGVEGFTKWLQLQGYKIDDVRKDAIPGMAQLYAAASSQDYSGLAGLGERYLSEEDRAALGDTPSSNWLRPLLRAMSEKGMDNTTAMDTRARMADIADLQSRAGSLLLKAGNVLYEGSMRLLDVVSIFDDATTDKLEGPSAEKKQVEVGSGFLPGGMPKLKTVPAQENSEPTARKPGDIGGGFLPGGMPKVGVGNAPLSMIEKTAAKYDLPPGLLSAVADVESSFNPRAIGGKGEVGMFQFMPATAEEWGIDPADPQSAADGAARYLSHLKQKFGTWELALAAYNAGMGTVRLAGNKMPNIASTQTYVKKVMGRQSLYSHVAGQASAGMDELMRLPAEGGPGEQPGPAAGAGTGYGVSPNGMPQMSPWGQPGGNTGGQDMHATIEIVQKTDRGEEIDRHVQRFQFGHLPQPPHLLLAR